MLYVANSHTDLVAGLGIRRRLMLLQQAYFDTDRETLIGDDGERDDPDRALSLINASISDRFIEIRAVDQEEPAQGADHVGDAAAERRRQARTAGPVAGPVRAGVGPAPT